MNNWCICWFSRILLLGILIFKGLTAQHLYKSFGVKGLIFSSYIHCPFLSVGTLLVAQLVKALRYKSKVASSIPDYIIRIFH
jgi:hypothetical protein